MFAFTEPLLTFISDGPSLASEVPKTSLTLFSPGTFCRRCWVVTQRRSVSASESSMPSASDGDGEFMEDLIDQEQTLFQEQNLFFPTASGFWQMFRLGGVVKTLIDMGCLSKNRKLTRILVLNGEDCCSTMRWTVLINYCSDQLCTPLFIPHQTVGDPACNVKVCAALLVLWLCRRCLDAVGPQDDVSIVSTSIVDILPQMIGFWLTSLQVQIEKHHVVCQQSYKVTRSLKYIKILQDMQFTIVHIWKKQNG